MEHRPLSRKINRCVPLIIPVPWHYLGLFQLLYQYLSSGLVRARRFHFHIAVSIRLALSIHSLSRGSSSCPSSWSSARPCQTLIHSKLEIQNEPLAAATGQYSDSFQELDI